MVFGFRVLPMLYDAVVTPLMKRLALSAEPTEPNSGNVFEPRPDLESTRDGWSLLGIRSSGARSLPADRTEALETGPRQSIELDDLAETQLVGQAGGILGQ